MHFTLDWLHASHDARSFTPAFGSKSVDVDAGVRGGLNKTRAAHQGSLRGAVVESQGVLTRCTNVDSRAAPDPGLQEA